MSSKRKSNENVNSDPSGSHQSCSVSKRINSNGTNGAFIHFRSTNPLSRMNLGGNKLGEEQETEESLSHQSSSSLANDTSNHTISGKKRTSWIWAHFGSIKDQETKCKCNYCPKTFVKNGTGTMARHMENKHAEKIKKSTQTTRSKTEEIVKPFSFDVDAADKAFIKFIVANNHPFSLGEEPAFREFISTLQPLYKPLSEKDVRAYLESIFDDESSVLLE